MIIHYSLIGNVWCQTIHEVGPQNITRMNGDTNVVILCPYCTNFSPKIWEINGISYAWQNLPRAYSLIYGGLLIEGITSELNNTSFKCFYPIPGSVIVQPSSVGFLTVINNTLSHSLTSK